MMSDLIQDSVMTMASRWLQSLAASFASAGGLMAIVAVLAGLYLFRKLSKRMAEKFGVGMGPILAIGLIVAAVFGLRSGRATTGNLHATLPPGVVKGEPNAAAKAGREQDARSAKSRNTLSAQQQRDLAAVNAAIASATPVGVAPPVMMPVTPMPHLPAIPHAGSPGGAVHASQAAAPHAASVVTRTVTVEPSAAATPAASHAPAVAPLAVVVNPGTKPSPNAAAGTASPPAGKADNAASSSTAGNASSSPSPASSVAAAVAASTVKGNTAAGKAKPISKDHPTFDWGGSSTGLDVAGGRGKAVADSQKAMMGRRPANSQPVVSHPNGQAPGGVNFSQASPAAGMTPAGAGQAHRPQGGQHAMSPQQMQAMHELNWMMGGGGYNPMIHGPMGGHPGFPMHPGMTGHPGMGGQPGMMTHPDLMTHPGMTGHAGGMGHGSGMHHPGGHN